MPRIRPIAPRPTGYTPAAGAGALAAAGGVADAEPCVTCGRPAGTPYCPHCGERRAADRPHTLRELAHEAADALSPADGRGVRAVWLLLRRPGLLTAEHARGVRQPYLPPLRLFVLVNLLYFAAASWTGMSTFSTPLRTHVGATAHAEVATRMVRARLAARRTTFAAYAPVFDRVAVTQAKSLVGAMVPGFALAVAAAGWRRRSAAHHLAFALHGCSALLLLFVALHVAVNLPVEVLARDFGWRLTAQRFDDLASAAYSLAAGAYLYRALRRAYGDGPLAAAAKAAWLTFAFWVLLFAYRVLLFFVTFWTT